MSLGLLVQLWCLLVVVNVASTATTFTYGDEPFTYFPTYMSWPEAVRHCVSEGMRLAEPRDDIAVGLRKHMVDNNIIGKFGTWLSGGGDGVGALRWTPPGGGAVSPSGPVVAAHLLWPGAEKYWESRNCLAILTYRVAIERQPSRPYSTRTCSGDRTVLCQEERGIKKVEVYNVEYKTNTASVVRAPATSKVTVITNKSNHPQEAVRVISVSYQTSKDWGNSFGFKSGVTGTVTAGVPLVAAAEVAVSHEISYAHTWGTSKTETKKDEIRATLTVPAKSRQSVWVTYTKNTINIDYIASMKIYYVDGGSIIRKREPGVFKGVDAAEFHIVYGEDESLE